MKIAPNRWWDWTAVLCFLAALITASYRFIDTKWTEDLNLVVGITLLGAIIGLGLGLSKFKPLAATLLGLGYTLVVLPYQFSKIIPGEVVFSERLTSVGGRLWNSLYLFLQNKPLTDSILFLANMLLLFWFVAIVGGYNLTRRGKPWLSMIIAGIAILVIDIYHPAVGTRGVAMAIFAVLALVLITRIHFLNRKRQWDGEEITVDSDTGFSWGRGALITGIVLVVLAWNASNVVKAFAPNTPERHRVVSAWNDIRQRFENAVRPLRGTTVVPREYYGDDFSLGTGSQLSDRVILAVEPNIQSKKGLPYYWRVRSYNFYSDGKWHSTVNTTEPYSSNQRIVYESTFESRLTVHFSFHPERNLSMLYAPSMVYSVSRPVSLMRETVDGKRVDVTSILVDPMIRPGEVYDVVSLVAAPSVLELRGSSTEYPEWIEKYLQLPDDMPQSISDLALEITAGLENPYDKAAAVTTWLRENIIYSQILPTIPPGEDPIEWMLFTHKQAFCNYYATAEVLMLRSLGIPARWVVGYAQGEYDAEAKAYKVRERDAHAWPEVFFPEYGWVEFEPTASQGRLIRPSGEASADGGIQDPDANTSIEEENIRDQSVEEDAFDRFDNRSNLQPTIWDTLRTAAVVGGIFFLPLFAFLMYRLGKRNPQLKLPVIVEKTLRKRGWKVPVWVVQWSNFVDLTPMEKVFVQISWILRFLRSDMLSSSTPAEQIQQLIRILPESQEPAFDLLAEYQNDAYSPRPGDIQAAKGSVRALWKIAVRYQVRVLGDWVSTGQKPPRFRPSTK